MLYDIKLFIYAQDFNNRGIWFSLLLVLFLTRPIYLQPHNNVYTRISPTMFALMLGYFLFQWGSQFIKIFNTSTNIQTVINNNPNTVSFVIHSGFQMKAPLRQITMWRSIMLNTNLLYTTQNCTLGLNHFWVQIQRWNSIIRAMCTKIFCRVLRHKICCTLHQKTHIMHKKRKQAHGKAKCWSSAWTASVNCLGNTPTKPCNSWIPKSCILSSTCYLSYKRPRQRLLFPTIRITYLRWKDLYRIDPTAQNQNPFCQNQSLSLIMITKTLNQKQSLSILQIGIKIDDIRYTQEQWPQLSGKQSQQPQTIGWKELLK